MDDRRKKQIADDIAKRLKQYDEAMRDEPIEDVESLADSPGVIAMCVGGEDVFLEVQPA